MRSHSTHESALNLEITKLAIAETGVSLALYVGVGLYLGTFQYLALAVLVAPIMLLRTEKSTDWGLRAYRELYEAMSRQRILLYWLLVPIGLPIGGICIRVVATVYSALQRPLWTLRTLPQNWLRQTLCTDFFHPPEIIPGEVSHNVISEKKVPEFPLFLDLFRLEEGHPALLAILLSPLLMFGFLPSLIYRITFKATSIVYLPLVFVARLTLQSTLPLKVRLARITKGELEKVRRGISWGIVTILAAKIGLELGWVNLGYVAAKFPSQQLLEALLVPKAWAWWQIAVAADALLTFFLLFFADAALARLEGGHSWRDETVQGAVSTVSFTRGILSLAAISHGFYLAAVEADLLTRLLESC